MALKWDPEFAAAAAPMLQMAASLPPIPVHDVQGRRTMVKEVFGGLLANMAVPTDVDVTEHKIKSHDGAEISVYRVAKQGTLAAPGPAIVHCHGGNAF